MTGLDLESRDRTCWCGNKLTDKPRNHCRTKGRHRCGAKHGRGNDVCEKPRRQCQQDRKRARDELFANDPSKAPLSAGDIIKGIKRHYREQVLWALFDEFRVGIGHQHDVVGIDPSDDDVTWERRVDLLAISCWPKRGPNVVAYEVKISRGDLLNELKHPEKREAAKAISTQMYLATPPGLMKLEEVPDDIGLVEIEYTRRGAIRYHQVVEAPERELGPIHWRTFASLAGRVAELERMRPLSHFREG